MKKVSWIWLLIVSIVFVNVSVWLHFIYYEKKYEKIVEERTARYQSAMWTAHDEARNLSSENRALVKLVNKKNNEIWLLSLLPNTRLSS